MKAHVPFREARLAQLTQDRFRRRYQMATVVRPSRRQALHYRHMQPVRFDLEPLPLFIGGPLRDLTDLPARLTDGIPRIAMIIGGANCVWTDIAALEALIGRPWPDFGITVACNMAGVHYGGRLDHWVTMHSEYFSVGGSPKRDTPPWKTLRRGNQDYCAWTRTGAVHLQDFHRIVHPWGGSSGLLSTRVAMDDLQSPKAVLCGVPQNDERHFDRPGAWLHAESFKSDWEKVARRLGDRIRSMSGWTAELFGRPTKQWLLQ